MTKFALFIQYQQVFLLPVDDKHTIWHSFGILKYLIDILKCDVQEIWFT